MVKQDDGKKTAAVTKFWFIFQEMLPYVNSLPGYYEHNIERFKADTGNRVEYRVYHGFGQA